MYYNNNNDPTFYYDPMYNPGYPIQYPGQYSPYNNGADNNYYYQPEQYSESMKLMDYGPEPFAINIHEASKQNDTFRTALWTGEHLQVTLMSIPVGEDIGFEIHPDIDQFLRIEEGEGIVLMGDSKDDMDFQQEVFDDYAFVVPAGKWHNLINIGNMPLKLYSIYAPPKHPHGTVHETKEDAMKS